MNFPMKPTKAKSCNTRITGSLSHPVYILRFLEHIEGNKPISLFWCIPPFSIVGRLKTNETENKEKCYNVNITYYQRNVLLGRKKAN